MKILRSSYTPIALTLMMLATMLGIEVSSAMTESQVIDEAVHLAAGISYWKTGDFRMNPEHPPLVKLVSALPFAFLPTDPHTEQPTWQSWNEWEYADYLLYHSIFSVDTMLLIGRIPLMLVSILLGWLIYKVSSSFFGPWGGVLSVALYAFDPNIIAHSRYITTDLSFTAAAFWCVVRFDRLFQKPTRSNAILFSVAIVIAGLTKFSMMPFLIGLGITYLMLQLRSRAHPIFSIRRVVRWALISLSFGALITWALYGFDIRRPSDDPRINQLYAQREKYLSVTDVTTLPPLERFVVTKMGDRGERFGAELERLSRYPVIGYAFFRGVFSVIGHSIGGQESYLLGSYSDRGWWYYFPVAFLVKTPLPILVAIISVALLATQTLRSLRRRTGSFKNAWNTINPRYLLYTVPPTIFFLLAVTSNLNLGWRHIMPLYPFIAVAAGSITLFAGHARFRKISYVPGILLALSMVIIQFTTFPNELGYFNEVSGGTVRGPRYLLDSNIDWGQDLPKLKRYVHENRITSIPYEYYGRAVLNAYVPEATRLPTAADLNAGAQVPHGMVAISIGALYRRDNAYQWLGTYTPETRIGSSIYIYNLNP